MTWLISAWTRVWQILTAVFAMVSLILFIGKTRADKKALNTEKEKALLEAEQARKDAARAKEDINAQERQRQALRQAQERINEAAEGKDLREGSPPSQKPEKSKPIVFMTLLFILLSACAPKIISETEYIYIRPELPVLYEIQPPELTPVVMRPQGDNVDIYCTSYDNASILFDYLSEISAVVRKLNGQIREYSKFRGE